MSIIQVDWDKRIQRAGDLAGQYAFAAEVLNFYAEIASFQKRLYEHVSSNCTVSAEDRRSLREQLDLRMPLWGLPELLSLVEKNGPPGLAGAARELCQEGPQKWHDVLGLALHPNHAEQNGTDPAQFFARVCLQPCAEYLARHSGLQLAGYTGTVCPLCNAAPVMAVLRAEGDGAKRSLLCAFCLQEWNFRRLVCPACGEQDNQKLPRFSAADFPHIRIEACDTCKTYLKAVDLTVNGLAVPIVDEIAAAPLDLWAGEHGYRKTELNLMGC